MERLHIIWACVFLTALCCRSISAEPYKYTVGFFDVPIDHFSFASNKTFKIRYLINDTYWDKHNDSPIFFYTGNEGNIELFAQNTGFMWEIAEEFKATLAFVEHRYYGKSLPFDNKSFTAPEYSGYLTSEQALADFASILVNQLNKDNRRPVITFGGSYGGMLSAWFRMKYPHLVTGAIASSAPIFQFTTDCNAFNMILSSVFMAGQANCSRNIFRTWDIIKKEIATPEGRNSLNHKFKFCTNLTKPEDANDLFDYLGDVYGNLAMVNYPYPTSFLAPLPANPVTEFCAFINATYTDDQLLDAFQKSLSVYTNYTGATKCVDISSAYDEDMGAFGWDFQSCTEMVMPMCSKRIKKNMFPPKEWDFKTFSDRCYQRFKVRPNPTMATVNYGDSLKYASNIVFSNGLMDPWSGGGVLRSQNDDIDVIIVPDSAHHLDLRAANPNDPITIRETRELEKKAIRKWLSQD